MSAAKNTAVEKRVAELEKVVAELEKKVEELLSQKSTGTGGAKEKKEKVKRAVSAWSLFVKHVTSEMKAANPDGKLKLPEIAAEAKKRKDSGGYDEAHWKELASKANA